MRYPNLTTQYSEPLNSQVRQWILILLVPLGGMHSYTSNEVINDALLQAIFNFDDLELELSRQELYALLRKAYRRGRTQQTHLPEMLRNNIADLAQLISLNAVERSILEFAIVLAMNTRLADAAELLGELNTAKLFYTLALLLGHSEDAIRTALSRDAALMRTGIFNARNFEHQGLTSKLDLLSVSFADTLYCGTVSPHALLSDEIKKSAPAQLKRQDYSSISAHLDILLPYLAHSLQQRSTGVNILLHGEPGTGKTELARLLAQLNNCQLYEVASEDSDGDSVSSQRRLGAYRAAQHFFANNDSMLVFDEVEDIFSEPELSFFSPRSAIAGKNKAWINQILELNSIPTVWISNSIHQMDPAFVRRFDFVIEVPLPNTEQRSKLLKRYSKDLLDKKTLQRLAGQEQLSPAVIERAARVVSSIAPQLENPAQAMQLLINSTLTSQGHSTRAPEKHPQKTQYYDPALIRADIDLAAMTEGLIAHPNARLCLFGPPGTGKTAYAHWLAEQLDKPLIVKRASDLLAPYVG